MARHLPGTPQLHLRADPAQPAAPDLVRQRGLRRPGGPGPGTTSPRSADDAALRRHIEQATARSARRGLADRRVRYARRVGWYAIVRATRPAHVVETGVDKGLGSCVLAAALLRNAAEGHPGRVTSLDINPEAGYLARSAPWSEVVDLVIGDSIAAIAALDRPVDLFLHDSDHSRAHEKREFDAVEPKLAPGAILLTDNVTTTNVLAEHAERTGRRFLAYRESPADHWYPATASVSPGEVRPTVIRAWPAGPGGGRHTAAGAVPDGPGVLRRPGVAPGAVTDR